MLNIMRKYATSWLIKVLLGAIVVVFVLWGVGNYKTQKANRVAVVNGEAIGVEEYKMVYTQMIEQLRRQLGNNLSEELLGAFQVKQNALNQIIDKRLLLTEARRLNFRITDNELTQAIAEISAFQTNGVFDTQRYQSLLSMNRLSPETFELQQREMMLIGKLKAYIEGSVKVSEAEAMEWYNWQNLAIDINYVLFDPAKYEDIQASEAEINAYYEKYKQNYKTNPEVKVRYAAFKPSAYRHLVKISETELKNYYDANPELYQLPKTVEARHILFMLDPDADAKTVEKVRSRADDIYEKAKGGQDFAALAKQYSEGPSKDQGGYLGTFKKEDMIEPFSEKAFSMKAGEISEPVRTRYGWHIIKIEKVNEATHRTFVEAKEDISMKLVDDNARLLAYDDAEAVFNAAYDGGNLPHEGVSDGKIKTTGFFDRKGPEGLEIKSPVQFAQAAFKLETDEISDVQDFEDGYYILQIVEKRPERVPPLADVRAGVTADLKKSKQEERAKQDAESLLSELKNGTPVETAVKNRSMILKQTGYFKKTDSVPEIGYDRAVADAAFDLSDRKPLPEKVVKGSKGFYVVQYKSQKEPDGQTYEKDRVRTKNELLNRKKTKTFTEWLARLKKNSTIEITEGFEG